MPKDNLQDALKKIDTSDIEHAKKLVDVPNIEVNDSEQLDFQSEVGDSGDVVEKNSTMELVDDELNDVDPKLLSQRIKKMSKMLHVRKKKLTTNKIKPTNVKAKKKAKAKQIKKSKKQNRKK